MVFNKESKVKSHHTRVNLRDTSTEPNNLHGDANVITSPTVQARLASFKN